MTLPKCGAIQARRALQRRVGLQRQFVSFLVSEAGAVHLHLPPADYHVPGRTTVTVALAPIPAVVEFPGALAPRRPA